MTKHLKWYLMAALIPFCPALSAQSGEDLTRRINSIKESSEYIYAESTTRELTEAEENARILLRLNVEDWLSTAVPEEEKAACLEKIPALTQEMQARRGILYRAFLYVRKADLVPSVAVPPGPAVPVVIAEVVYVPEEIPAVMKDEETVEKVPEAPVLSALEEKMLSVKRFSDVKSFVTSLEKEGVIRDYGKYATMPSGEPCYVFVYDRSGDVVAHIKVTVDQQTDLVTGGADPVSNHKNCGAFWFRVVEK